MATATLGTKGQLVIPKSIRDSLHIQPGDRMDFLLQKNGVVLIKPVTEDVRRLKGALHKPGRKPVTVEAMNAAIRSTIHSPLTSPAESARWA